MAEYDDNELAAFYCEIDKRLGPLARMGGAILKKGTVLRQADYMDAAGIAEIDKRLAHDASSFREKLFAIIDEKGLTDAEVYKGAGMDRRLFAKIRNEPNHLPKSDNVLALAVSMHLTLDETNELMRAAGYALSGIQKRDIIVAYFIEKRIYDMHLINCALLHYDVPLLGKYA